MSSLTLERSLHILGPIIGRKRGVQVMIGGSQAATDGNTVFLPALPPEDREGSVLGLGFLFHESNHLRHTDFRVDKGEGLVGTVTNALEDIRIDGLGHQEYAGGRAVEEDLVATLLRREEAQRPRAGDHPARLLEHYLMWRLEYDLLSIEAAKGVAQESEALFREAFPPGVATKLDGLMFTLRECTSTAEVKALALRIAAMLEAEAKDEEAKHRGSPAPSTGSGSELAPMLNPMRRALEAGEQDHAQDLGQMIAAALQHQAGSADPNASLSMPVVVSFEPAPRKAGTSSAFQFDVRGATNALRQRLAGLL